MTHLASHDVATGSILGGRYQLDERIGEGGMAVVYRAHDLALQRPVAIKVMRGPTEGARERARIQSETTLLASLSHPSLVTLFDAHISPTSPSYLVMELVEGRTLRDRLDDGPLGTDEAAALAVDLAEALHMVHEKGVVHRDIKPSNVLLWPSPLPDREFRVKLTDFGIAYLLDATRVTAPGTVIGTAAYLAPEQVRGERPTPAADIYGLGLLLLEAITGRRAFGDAVGHEALIARLAASPSIPDDLPGPWRALLGAMTAATPGRRPTALQVALAATALRERHPSTAEMLTTLMDPAITAPAIVPVDQLTEAMDAPAAREGAVPREHSPATRTHVLPTEPEPPSSTAHARPIARRLVIAIVAVVVAVAAALGIGVAVANANRPDPTQPLPSIQEPLGTDLHTLYEEVTP